MPRRHSRQELVRGDSAADGNRDLAEEFDKLSRETTTDAILNALENELRSWAPEEDEEGELETTIDRLNRQLVAKSVFRERLDEGYHEDVGNMRPAESEVRKGLEELRQLISEGKSPRRR